MPDKTWEDLKALIKDELPRDAVTNDAVYLRRVNIAIGIINDKSGGFEDHWSNDPTDAEDGTLVLSGNICTFPADLQEPRTVHWAGVPLDFRTEAQLDRLGYAWRSRSGTPAYFTLTARGLMLDANPGADTGGPLEIWGLGCIPELDLSPESPNPFAYLPTPHQMAPAFYVLGYLPLFGRAKEEVVAIQADYRRQWDEFVASLEWGVITRRYPRQTS